MLPITLWKSAQVKSGHWSAEKVFYSSGTTAMTRSSHFIRDLAWYHRNAEEIWTATFGPLEDYVFISLLPNYHLNPSSSLLSMVDHFMERSADGLRHYFLDDIVDLYGFIEQHKDDRLVLFGVSFALLDYAGQYNHLDLDNLIVIETGGMKKDKRRITRTQLHQQLASCFGSARICSEYGMTECLSQLYSDGPFFQQNDQMRIQVYDPTDPRAVLPSGTRGRIGIIDLAKDRKSVV